MTNVKIFRIIFVWKIGYNNIAFIQEKLYFISKGKGVFMGKYQDACKERESANNKCLAELFLESCVGNPHITDKNGNWLTKEQVYEKLLRGDKE